MSTARLTAMRRPISSSSSTALDGAVEEADGAVVEGDDEFDAVGAAEGLLLICGFHGGS